MKLNTDSKNESTAVSIPFDALMLGAIIRELSPLICGGQIQDIRHPESNELHIGIRTRSETLRLLISIDARFARVHLTSQRAANSPIPTEFCSALRRKIEGGKIDSVIQIGLDRIMELGVVSDIGDGKLKKHKLIVELMGKHSNIILVEDAGGIVESAKGVSHRINRVRQTLPGLTYIRPPGAFDAPFPSLLRIANDIASAVGEDRSPTSLAAAIRQFAPFLSPFLAMEIALRSTIEDHDAIPYRSLFVDAGFAAQISGPLHQRIMSSLESIFTSRNYQPVIANGCRGAGAYPIPLLQIPAHQQTPIFRQHSSTIESALAPTGRPYDSPGQRPGNGNRPREEALKGRDKDTSAAVIVLSCFSLNQAMDHGYANLLQTVQKQEAGNRLSAEIGRELARQSSTSISLRRTIDEASRADLLTQSGDLLLANLWQFKTGDEQIVVTDYYDWNGGSRTIRLNPKLSPQENAEALYDKARRSRLGLATAQTRLNKSSNSLAGLNNARMELQALIDDPTAQSSHILELSDRLTQEGLLRAASTTELKEAPLFQGHRIRREVTPEGYEILVGDSATANDFLTTRVAASNDLWLHVRSAAGGHVVIRANGMPETVPDSVLERAAVIAALHSAQKHSSLVAVDYTLKKYVRKPRGSAPGAVVIEREKTLHVSPGQP